MRGPDDAEREPDIVLAILQLVRLVNPGVTQDQASEIEQQVRTQYGGLRTRIAKRKKHPSAEQRKKIFSAALADVPEDEILKESGISRRSLYNYVKRGGQ